MMIVATQADIDVLLNKIEELCTLAKKVKSERDELVAALKEMMSALIKQVENA
jgi:hypothetical protein